MFKLFRNPTRFTQNFPGYEFFKQSRRLIVSDPVLVRVQFLYPADKLGIHPGMKIVPDGKIYGVVGYGI